MEKNMETSRFYFRWRWWHGLLILLVLVMGLLVWVSTWDLAPKVKPKLFPQPALEVTNQAWIGYYLQPFQIRFMAGNNILLILKSADKQFVKARRTTTIPLETEFGSLQVLQLLSLRKIRVAAAVTASRWGLEKTVVVDRDMGLADLLDEFFEPF